MLGGVLVTGSTWGVAGLGAADLVGNWSSTVWLLIPLVLLLALLTALCLGPAGEPTRTRGETGGVSRYLARSAKDQGDT